MNLKRVVLPRKTAEAIESVWASYGKSFAKHMVLTNWSMLKDDHVKEYEELSNYAYLKPLDYMIALTNGYEVEQTPEEKAAVYIKELGHQVSCDQCGKNEYDACRKLLHILGIKIEGIKPWM